MGFLFGAGGVGGSCSNTDALVDPACARTVWAGASYDDRGTRDSNSVNSSDVEPKPAYADKGADDDGPTRPTTASWKTLRRMVRATGEGETGGKEGEVTFDFGVFDPGLFDKCSSDKGVLGNGGFSNDYVGKSFTATSSF